MDKIRARKHSPKTGLVLGSGAARGLAHIGVIKALKEKNVRIDMIAGSSIGALVGACYARKGDISDIEKLVLKMDWIQLLQLADWNLAFMFKGFIHGQKVNELLDPLIGDIEFKDLKIPLVVVATELNTGREVLIDEGSVLDAVRASISIPVVFMPMQINDRFLVDGGIVNPVPVKVARSRGMEYVIASNVLQPPNRRNTCGSSNNNTLSEQKYDVLEQVNERLRKLIQENEQQFKTVENAVEGIKKTFSKLTANKERDILESPNIFDVLFQVIYSMEHELARRSSDRADLVITPETSSIASLEFSKAKPAIHEGYRAAVKAL